MGFALQIETRERTVGTQYVDDRYKALPLGFLGANAIRCGHLRLRGGHLYIGFRACWHGSEFPYGTERLWMGGARQELASSKAA